MIATKVTRWLRTLLPGRRPAAEDVFRRGYADAVWRDCVDKGLYGANLYEDLDDFGLPKIGPEPKKGSGPH